MGVKQDAEDSLKDYFITKIDGQPTKQDISKPNWNFPKA